MAFGSLGGGDEPVMAEINMVPLIDVMLVLLVIFLVTAPLLSQAVKVQLPQANSARYTPPQEPVRLTLAADGQVYWQDQPVLAEDVARLATLLARSQPETEVQLRADKAVPYGSVAEAMAAVHRAGLTRIAFVSDPVAAARP